MSEKPKLKPGLPELTARIAALPVSENGLPIPFFVANIDGKPDFRVVDPEKLFKCVKRQLCWICGHQLGKMIAFVGGPLCVVNHISADAPMHYSCAEWSVKACPFMLNPNMRRREDEITDQIMAETISTAMVMENPGVYAIYQTTGYNLVKQGGGIVFAMGLPIGITWWKGGKGAKRADVMVALQNAMPTLEAQCITAKDVKDLHKRVQEAMKWIDE